MITILTHNKNKNFITKTRNILKYIVLFFNQKLYLDLGRLFQLVKYSGHIDVTKSLIDGLKENKIEFNINPKKKKYFYGKVIVLSGYDELIKAIELKKEKTIDYIIAGPNICVLPTDIGNTFANKEIDKVITPSKWVTNSYIKNLPIIEPKIAEWPAGVDTKVWSPKYQVNKKYVLIYLKKPFNIKNVSEYIKILNQKNISYRIIKYGFYNPKIYLKLLQSSKYSIFFSISESQGIAMLESWSVGVPSMNLQNNSIIYKESQIICNTSPYLTKETGLEFKNIIEFREKLDFIEKNYKKFNSRNWVLKNLTNKKSSEIILKI